MERRQPSADAVPYSASEIAEYIVDTEVMSAAVNADNKRIRRALDREMD